MKLFKPSVTASVVDSGRLLRPFLAGISMLFLFSVSERNGAAHSYKITGQM